LVSSGARASVTVREADEHPYWMFRLDEDSRLSRFAEPAGGMPLRRQDLPPAWSLNGAVYVADCKWFLENRTFLSPATVGYPMPASRSLDIDSLEDILQLQRIAAEMDAIPTTSDAGSG
jgi:CMP-N-acetylneuraminic acid synthetase